MADLVVTQLYDGARNVVVNIQDLSDGTGLNLLKIINVALLVPNPGIYLKLYKVNYDVKGGQVILYWEATSDELLLLMQDEEATRDFSGFGGIKNNAGAGVTGNVLLSTQGFVANSSFTLNLEFKKGGPLPGVITG
jgi:hypothetical protein